YYYQLVAANGVGTNAGSMLSVTSSVAAPYVTTLPATQITGSAGTLQGAVDPNGVSTAYYFRWGTTTNFGNFTITNSVGSGSSTTSVSVALSGLLPLTTYYYQLIA